MVADLVVAVAPVAADRARVAHGEPQGQVRLMSGSPTCAALAR
jgi:hypothetical protein